VRARSQSRSRLTSLLNTVKGVKKRYLSTWGRRHGEMSGWQRAAGIYNRAHFSPGTKVSATNGPNKKRKTSVARTLNFPKKRGRGGNVYGVGSVGKQFSKKFKSNVNKFVKYGYIRKRESGAVVTDTNCVYLGHNAIAMDDMWKSIIYSVTRWFARKAGQDFVSFDSPVSGLASVDPNITWRITFKQQPDGIVGSDTVITTGTNNWGQMGDNLYTLIKNNLGTLSYFELCQIELYSPDTVANTRDFPYISVEAKQFMVEVVGNSNLMLQNTTLASVADADGDMEDNVTNNPLVGKMYEGKGQNFPVAFQNVTVGPTLNLSPKTDFQTGVITFDYSAVGNMSAVMRNQLIKPPPYFHFSGMTGNQTVILKPGAIRRSNVKSVVKHSIMKWIQLCYPFLKPNSGNTESAQNIKFLGHVHMFGLERMLDSRSDEAPLRLAYECNLTTSAVAYYHPSLKCIPQVFVN